MRRQDNVLSDSMQNNLLQYLFDHGGKGSYSIWVLLLLLLLLLLLPLLLLVLFLILTNNRRNTQNALKNQSIMRAA